MMDVMNFHQPDRSHIGYARPASVDEAVALREFRISANDVETLEPLRTAIYETLDVIRIYTKDPKKKEADRGRPFTLRHGDTLLDLAELIHKDYAKNLKFGKVWGSAVHDGTVVKADYELNDMDVIEVHV